MKNLLCTTIAMLLPIAAASAADLKASPKSASIAVTPVALNISPSVYLPAVASLTKDSDYAAFLKADVPLEIQQQALRQLWSSVAAELPKTADGGGAF